MNGRERDERQTAALERIGAMLSEGERRASDRERAKRDRQTRAGFPPLRRIFQGEAGTRLIATAIPGFVALWERIVPESYVDGICDLQSGQEWPLMRCPCGSATVLDELAPIECESGCGRWYLWTGEQVRVHNFAAEAVAA